ncbi:protein SMG9 isoform X1 [Octopus sinensis]|uniref:Protein SMG9 isoform X1 n=1 Tax=Octopus sinensis TaxID=2607531 RepID=A0A6P7SE19_9MOLL|nr:protein SMG9 isoform X1 [Octopus sinensis]
MSDPLERGDRGGRNRRRRRAGRKDFFQERGDRDLSDTGNLSSLNSKPPIILAKPHSSDLLTTMNPTSSSSLSGNNMSGVKMGEKQIVVLKAREDSTSSSTSVGNSCCTSSGICLGASLSSGRSSTPASSLHNINAAVSSDLSSHSTSPYQMHRNTQLSSMDECQNRLAPLPEMPRCIKLVDDSMHWCDTGMEVLVDQNNFFVVGVLGMQGVGKSTIMSLLAGNSSSDYYRNFVFQPQSKEIREVGSHQTSGVDMFVTNDRVILLDTQPVLSASVLDMMIHHDKKYPAEYSTAENCMEMQSLQLAAFMMTVCNVLLVVQDWFTDINFLRFLLTAEMLKPSTPANSHDDTSVQENTADYYPQIVFVQNKAVRDDFSVETYRAKQCLLSKVLENSKLKYKDAVTLATGELLPGLNNRNITTGVNLFLLPHMDNQKVEADSILTFLPEYRGYPSFNRLLQSLRNQVFACQRRLLTHTILSEKNWFHYAARTWDTVKKSTLMAEYNRLLP